VVTVDDEAAAICWLTRDERTAWSAPARAVRLTDALRSRRRARGRNPRRAHAHPRRPL